MQQQEASVYCILIDGQLKLHDCIFITLTVSIPCYRCTELLDMCFLKLCWKHKGMFIYGV